MSTSPAPTTPAARPSVEAVLDATAPIEVGDPDEGHPVGVDAETGEFRQRAGHEALAARLVDRPVARFDDGDVQPRHPGLDRAREADRSATGNEHLGVERHQDAAARSARSSAGMRKRSNRIALSTVKTSAVIHAECTSGSAIPSTATTT